MYSGLAIGVHSQKQFFAVLGYVVYIAVRELAAVTDFQALLQ